MRVHLNGVLKMKEGEELFDFDDGLRGLGLFLKCNEFVDGFIEVKGLIHVEIPFGFFDLSIDRDVFALKFLVYFEVKELFSVVVRVD